MAGAKHELDRTIRDSIREFKKELRVKFILYEKRIAEFKTRIENDKNENKVKYGNNLAALERKNTEMKRKLEDYRDEEKEAWDTFKSAFSHDMDDLGNSISNFFSNDQQQ